MPVQIFGIVPGSIQVIRSLLWVGKSTAAERPRSDRGATARPLGPRYWEAGLTGT
jgi:hypothetical protein